jgi:hypothetical protein
MPWELERALICERIGWTRLPGELDEEAVEGLRGALSLLRVYRVFEAGNKDLKALGASDAELYAQVSEWINGSR